MEHIIYVRLEEHSERKPLGLAENQYVFRRHRSTIHVIKKLTEVASKAIEGTNSAYWAHIIQALERKKTPLYLLRIISSYLSDRLLLYETNEGPENCIVTGGVPQGSVLGPQLWKIYYKGVLRLSLPKEIQIIGYADDITLTVVAKEISQLKYHAAIKIIIKNRKKLEATTLNIDGYNISTQHSLKYLGVMIDTRLC